jgi:DNA adenine methylase
MSTFLDENALTLLPRGVKPFLKWAGGKGQLLDDLVTRYPQGFGTNRLNKYVEPFVGGGAVFFYNAGKYRLSQSLLVDINEELISTYVALREEVERVITLLAAMEKKYLTLTLTEQEEYYYRIRSEFNEGHRSTSASTPKPDIGKRSALLIFLNRTCFNGLFRVNGKGHFNVPFGRYKNPTICAADNLRLVSRALQDVVVQVGDFSTIEPFVDEKTFVYFDPPYRPLTKTSNFTSYSKDSFGDPEQLRLATFFRKLHDKGAKLMLSNSDPRSVNPDDDFFEKAYSGFNIGRVLANRMINSKADGRGQISELLITNY